jgi:hypothetical protein
LLKQSFKQYCIYVGRWILCAFPGYIVLNLFNQFMNQFCAMILSQMVLGMIIFFIDRKIFGGIK